MSKPAAAAGAVDEDYEALLASMEKQYEEEEERQKKEKKDKKKKGGKGATEEETTEADASSEVAAKEEPEAEKKKDKKKKPPAKASEAKKPASTKAEQQAKLPNGDATATPAATATATAEEPAAKETASTAKKGADKGKKGKAVPSGIAQLKKALEMANEKEEAMKREDEEKKKKEEENRFRIQEQERLEKERKDKKKQKEKERIERLKKEGKYMTQKQKEEKERAMLQLSAMGVKIPAKEEEQSGEGSAAPAPTSKPRYERIRKKQQAQDQLPQISALSLHDKNRAESGVKESWDAEEEEVREEWDAEAAKKASPKTAENTRPASAESEDESGEESGDEEEESEASDNSDAESGDSELTLVERIKLRLQRRHETAERERTVNNLRSPVICVLGHVDTGKTKILDNLRRSRVQEDEAGGITQQIGATNVLLETIKERTKMCRHIYGEIRVPGLLIIDTPGHEAFKSLRTRGSSLCDLAILVVDIMHGLEPQTIESLNILRDKKVPFIVALNKIDRLLDWKTSPQIDVMEVLKNQPANTQREFETRTNEVIVQLAEQGLNAALYYKNPDENEYISLVPTSAMSSDGIGNLMAMLIQQAQTRLAKRCSYSKELQCSVMEVKAIDGLGTTVDVCLVNGKLRVCDTIVIVGQDGPIVTQIRGLLLPQPNRELRVKNSWVMSKEVQGAQGVKIAARGLEKAMAGLPLYVACREDETDYLKDELVGTLRHALSSIRLSETGVFVQASTLGSLEALLEFLRTSKIPYAGISIGPVHKRDVTMASIMIERDPQYACILAFDVKVEREAQDMADREGVKIFTADIIYHLFDKFTAYREELRLKKREEFKSVAVFPCKLKILPNFVFSTRDPIICGVLIEAGSLKVNTPITAICDEVPSTEQRETKDKFVDLGRVVSIEYNNKPLEVGKAGQEVCIKIENTTGGAPRLLGRHFLATDPLVSKISRDSIDAVKNYFREDLSKADWQLVIELKKQFQIL